MGRYLANYVQPVYSYMYIVNYDPSSVGTYVDAVEVDGMRCDGVVEYIYEFYGHRVYGPDSYWDVSLNNAFVRDYHYGGLISPQHQATSYLTEVQ